LKRIGLGSGEEQSSPRKNPALKLTISEPLLQS
jgi:hypothetical protein